MKKFYTFIFLIGITTPLAPTYESDCENADLTTIDAHALAKYLNLQQKLFNRFKYRGYSEKLNYLSQTFGLCARYYIGKLLFDCFQLGYFAMNPRRVGSGAYPPHIFGLYFMTLLFTWRNAIDWHTSFATESGKKIHESAHLLGFALATCTPSLLMKFTDR